MNRTQINEARIGRFGSMNTIRAQAKETAASKIPDNDWHEW